MMDFAHDHYPMGLQRFQHEVLRVRRLALEELHKRAQVLFRVGDRCAR
jgi:hypothetical protein